MPRHRISDGLRTFLEITLPADASMRRRQLHDR